MFGCIFFYNYNYTNLINVSVDLIFVKNTSILSSNLLESLGEQHDTNIIHEIHFLLLLIFIVEKTCLGKR